MHERQTFTPSTTGPNRERLIALTLWAAGEQIKQKMGLPSEWDQADWLTRSRQADSCGTVCCLAGRVVLEDGGAPAGDDGQWADATEGYATGLAIVNGQTVNVEEYAQHALGLNDSQAARLFSISNDLDDVIHIVGDLLQLANGSEDAGTQPATVRERRLRAGRASCNLGPRCPVCYEDAPAGSSTA